MEIERLRFSQFFELHLARRYSFTLLFVEAVSTRKLYNVHKMFTHIGREHVCRRVNVSERIPIHEVVERRGENYGNSHLPRVSWIKDSGTIEGSFFGVNESQEGVANTKAEKAARR